LAFSTAFAVSLSDGILAPMRHPQAYLLDRPRGSYGVTK